MQSSVHSTRLSLEHFSTDHPETAPQQTRLFSLPYPAITRQRANFFSFLAIKVWGNLPASWQRAISKSYARIFDQAFSRHFIEPYCKLNYPVDNYLDHFVPPHGQTSYTCFQDFFIREFKHFPSPQAETVWPCEGVLCHFGKVGQIPSSNVKGDIRSVDHIFGLADGSVPKDYFFANVFLHNKNYHRIHSPIRATVSRIQVVSDELIILRPWIYMDNPSIPAFRNERINIDLVDEAGRTWYMSVVGGPAVGTIKLPEGLEVGKQVDQLEELALFYLGSTCCIASPSIKYPHEERQLVEVGEVY